MDTLRGRPPPHLATRLFLLQNGCPAFPSIWEKSDKGQQKIAVTQQGESVPGNGTVWDFVMVFGIKSIQADQINGAQNKCRGHLQPVCSAKEGG